MKLYVQQTIQIQTIKIGGITNSSVFQIGTSGIIKPASYLYNTGGFTKPAPTTDHVTTMNQQTESSIVVPFITGGIGAIGGAAGTAVTGTAVTGVTGR